MMNCMFCVQLTTSTNASPDAKGGIHAMMGVKNSDMKDHAATVMAVNPVLPQCRTLNVHCQWRNAWDASHNDTDTMRIKSQRLQAITATGKSTCL